MDAWTEGYNARQDDQLITTNPYYYTDNNHGEWWAGWTAADWELKNYNPN